MRNTRTTNSTPSAPPSPCFRAWASRNARRCDETLTPNTRHNETGRNKGGTEPKQESNYRSDTTCLWAQNLDVHSLSAETMRRGYFKKPAGKEPTKAECAEFRKRIRQAIADHFGDAPREVGTLLIDALVTADTDFLRTVKKAFKEADRVFHRHREKAVLDKFALFVSSFDDDVPPKAELLEMFRKQNNGKTLAEHQWRRLRKELNLPKDRPGRPQKSRH
jgi:hypothetical protein